MKAALKENSVREKRRNRKRSRIKQNTATKKTPYVLILLYPFFEGFPMSPKNSTTECPYP